MKEDYNTKNSLYSQFLGEHPEIISLKHFPTDREYIEKLYNKEQEFISSLD